MYKPRMVEFITDSAIDDTRTVDTRTGSKGFYPGDEILFDSFGVFGRSVRAMVVGYLPEHETMQYISDDNQIWHDSPCGYELENAKLIKRHASPKLIKQMRQI